VKRLVNKTEKNLTQDDPIGPDVRELIADDVHRKRRFSTLDPVLKNFHHALKDLDEIQTFPGDPVVAGRLIVPASILWAFGLGSVLLGLDLLPDKRGERFQGSRMLAPQLSGAETQVVLQML